MKFKVLIISLILVFSISCDKESVSKTWAVFNETQCANPWDQSTQVGTESRVQEYLKSNGINVYDIKIETVSSGPFCLACICSSGRIINVQIPDTDIDDIKRLGFLIKE
jgi:hypothetical protein